MSARWGGSVAVGKGKGVLKRSVSLGIRTDRLQSVILVSLPLDRTVDFLESNIFIVAR